MFFSKVYLCPLRSGMVRRKKRSLSCCAKIEVQSDFGVCVCVVILIHKVYRSDKAALSIC